VLLVGNFLESLEFIFISSALHNTGWLLGKLLLLSLPLISDLCSDNGETKYFFSSHFDLNMNKN